jgi:hypothetical protein
MTGSHESLRPAAFAAALIASLALGACTEGEGNPAASTDGAAFTVEDSAGIEVVDVWEAISPDGDAWRLAPEPSVTIGAVSGEAEYQFSDIAGALRLAPDTIVVLDWQSRDLRFFDGRGVHMFTAGGQGEGPGEVEWADELSRFPGGVQIRGKEKRVRFSSSGDLISDERFDWTPLQQYSCDLTFSGDDVFLCDFIPLGGLPAEGVVQRPQYRLLRADWGGERFDTVGLFTGAGNAYHQGPDGLYRHVFDPFERADRVAVGGSPLVLASLRRDRYEVTFMTTAGDTLRIVRRHGVRNAPEGEVLEELYRKTAEMLEVSPEVVAETFPAPESNPGGRSLLVDQSGNTWVGLWPSGDEDTGHDTYEVFLADGRLLGEVAIPAGSELMDVGEDYILVARTDEMDVPFVELYGLLKG